MKLFLVFSITILVTSLILLKLIPCLPFTWKSLSIRYSKTLSTSDLPISLSSLSQSKLSNTNTRRIPFKYVYPPHLFWQCRSHLSSFKQDQRYQEHSTHEFILASLHSPLWTLKNDCGILQKSSHVNSCKRHLSSDIRDCSHATWQRQSEIFIESLRLSVRLEHWNQIQSRFTPQNYSA